MKKFSLLLVPILVLGPAAFAGPNFEKCRLDVERSETAIANADNTESQFLCSVKVFSAVENRDGGICTGSITFQTICRNQQRTVSWGGEACCEK